MRLLEFDAKDLLADGGLPVLPHAAASDADGACAAAERLGYPVAIKADTAEGGRGKAGLVKRADSPEALRQAAGELLGAWHGGRPVRRLFLESWCPCSREIYMAEQIDSVHVGCVQLVSAAGGVDVESSAVDHAPVNPWFGFAAVSLHRALRRQGIDAAICERLLPVGAALHRVFVKLDARLVELNPVGIRPSGEPVVLDAKVFIDDNALARRSDLVERWRASGVIEPADFLRLNHGLEYVPLDGDVGLISGGAGMTMAAIDVIAERGGRAACFLDCSQNATPAGYGAALDLLLGDGRIRSLLINVVGGGTRVDHVAGILVALLVERRPTKPVVVRLEGTGAEEARRILSEAGLRSEESLEAAADAVVGLARGDGR